MLKYLVLLYLGSLICYVVVSMSFIYIGAIGLGQYISLGGIVLAAISRHHFLKLYKRIKHLQMVKNLVVEENPSL